MAIEHDVRTLEALAIEQGETIKALNTRIATLERQLTDMISVDEDQGRNITGLLQAVNTNVLSINETVKHQQDILGLVQGLKNRTDIFSENEDRFLAHLGRMDPRIKELEARHESLLKAVETNTATLANVAAILKPSDMPYSNPIE